MAFTCQRQYVPLKQLSDLHIARCLPGSAAHWPQAYNRQSSIKSQSFNRHTDFELILSSPVRAASSQIPILPPAVWKYSRVYFWPPMETSSIVAAISKRLNHTPQEQMIM